MIKEITLSVEFEKAIEYITNVVKCQERFLEPDEFYNAYKSYKSMNWKNPVDYVEFCEAYICVIKAIKELREVK